MKFLFLDTNIYLDLIVYRTKDNPPEAYSYLSDLLSWGTVKLIVPDIVKAETYRNLDTVVNEIGNNIKKLIGDIEKSFWMNIDDGEANEYNEKIRIICSELNKYQNKLVNGRQYKTIIKERLDIIFNSANVTIIPTDDFLLNNVSKRKIYKRCPFHKGEDAEADALILETLLNIKKYLNNICVSDQVFFVSRNYKEFSVSKNNKEELHQDIKEDLKNACLQDIVKYSPFFYKTLREDFGMEYISAKMFEREYQDYEGYLDWQAELAEMREDPHYEHLK